MQTQFNTSLWGDEGFSAILSMKSIPEIIRIIARDTSPPLWNISEHIVFQVFGADEVVIRGLSFSYFLLSVFFVYKIGNLLWSKRTGVLAAILTFLNPFFFIYAFEGRMYSILALGVTASMYFFIKIILNPNKIRLFNGVGYVMATLWAMYSHHFAIFGVFLQILWFLKEFFWGKRKLAISLLKLFIVVGIGYLPWLIPLYNQTRMVGSGFWLGTPTIYDLLAILGKYLGAGIPHSLRFVAPILTLSVILLRRWGKAQELDFFILSWFLLPIVTVWGISQFFQSIFFDRYLLYTIPGAMLICSSRARKLSGIFLGILLIIIVSIDSHYFTHPTKRPFRELASYVKETQQEGDFLINWNAASHHLWETKYYGIPAPIYLPERGELPFFVGTALMEEEDIIYEIPKNSVRVGVVTSGPVDEIVLPGYTEKEVKTFSPTSEGGSDIKFIWYRQE